MTRPFQGLPGPQGPTGFPGLKGPPVSSYALAPSPSTDHTAPPLPTCILKRSYLHVCRDLRGKTDCPATPDREERLYVRRRHLPSPAVCIRRHQQPGDGYVVSFFGVKTGIPRQDWPTWSSRRRRTSGESADGLPLVSTKGSLGHENVIIRPPSVFFFIKSLLIVHSRLPSIHPGRVRTKAWLHII